MDFANVFFEELVAVLPEYTKINTHAIDLEEGKQLFYGPIYSLGPVEIKTLKTYIETNLANTFICPSRSLVDALILFDQNVYGSLQLCIDYQGLNNLTIKNCYPLSLIIESFD